MIRKRRNPGLATVLCSLALALAGTTAWAFSDGSGGGGGGTTLKTATITLTGSSAFPGRPGRRPSPSTRHRVPARSTSSSRT